MPTSPTHVYPLLTPIPSFPHPHQLSTSPIHPPIMRTSTLIATVVAALAALAAPSLCTSLPFAVLRQSCPTYCWLGSTPRIEAVIHSRCPGGIANTIPCTRYRNERVEGRRLEGRTCNCAAVTPAPSIPPTTKFPTTSTTSYFPPLAPPTTDVASIAGRSSSPARRPRGRSACERVRPRPL